MPANGQAASAAQLNTVFGNGLNQKLAAGAASSPQGYQNESQQAADGNGLGNRTKASQADVQASDNRIAEKAPSGSTTPAPIVETVKVPVYTPAIPNPMHQFASWTYAWSLWWIDLKDYNSLMSKQTTADAMAWKPSKQSFVIAEDSGLYPDMRTSPVNGTYFGLNYNIQDVTLTTLITPNKTTRSASMIDGTMTIVEPQGVTLFDNLVAASFDPGNKKYLNYLSRPYMLQLDFVGYDDNGDPVPASETAIYRKRFPILLNTANVDVTTAGSKYEFTFVSAGSTAFSPEYVTTPKIFTITAGTVEEFLNGGLPPKDGKTFPKGNGLAAQFNDFQLKFANEGKQDFADSIWFDLDKDIATSKIVTESQVSLADINPAAKGIDVSKMSFVIPQGTPIVDIITRLMAHSDFLNKLQLGASKQSQTVIFNAFKTAGKVEYRGLTANGLTGPDAGAYDNTRNTFPLAGTYIIHQYPKWDNPHPATNGQLADSTDYSVKKYNYLYTGENIDIIDFKLNFETTYYTAFNAYATTQAAETPTQSTATDAAQQSLYIPPVTIGGLSRLIPQIGMVKNITPAKVRPINNPQNLTTGMGVNNNPLATTAMDVINTIYTTLNGDMMSVDVTIVGDPTLLKQDDWAYAPLASLTGSDYNAWDSENQYDFAKKYGHIRMDTGEVIVSLAINTAIDYDLDITDQGLYFPISSGYQRSLFSGQYRINTITSSFSNGKFEQSLNLSRLLNSDIVQKFNPSGGRSSVETNVKNQNKSVPTNGGTATISTGQEPVNNYNRD